MSGVVVIHLRYNKRTITIEQYLVESTVAHTSLETYHYVFLSLTASHTATTQTTA